MPLGLCENPGWCFKHIGPIIITKGWSLRANERHDVSSSKAIDLEQEENMKLILLHQYDPTVNRVGGIGTFTDALIRNAPNDIEIQLLCVTSQPKRYPGAVGILIPLEKKSLNFFL